MSKQIESLKLALEALELAQDNLRDHGDNCFLHDEGEYNRCFCGKDSLSDHLQSVVEKIEEALAQPKQEPVAYSYTSRITGAQGFSHHPMPRFVDSESWDIKPLYTAPPQRKPLTDEEIRRIELAVQGYTRQPFDVTAFARAIEAAHGIKE